MHGVRIAVERTVQPVAAADLGTRGCEPVERVPRRRRSWADGRRPGGARVHVPAARGRRCPARHRVLDPDACVAGVRPAEPGRDRGAAGPGRRVRGAEVAVAGRRPSARAGGGAATDDRAVHGGRVAGAPGAACRGRRGGERARGAAAPGGDPRRRPVRAPWPRWRAAWSLGSVVRSAAVPAAGPLPPPHRARRRSPRGVAAGCAHRRRSRGAGDAGARLVRPFVRARAADPDPATGPRGRRASCSDSCRRPGPPPCSCAPNPPQLPAPRTVAAVLDNVAAQLRPRAHAVRPGTPEGVISVQQLTHPDGTRAWVIEIPGHGGLGPQRRQPDGPDDQRPAPGGAGRRHDRRGARRHAAVRDRARRARPAGRSQPGRDGRHVGRCGRRRGVLGASRRDGRVRRTSPGRCRRGCRCATTGTRRTSSRSWTASRTRPARTSRWSPGTWRPAAGRRRRPSSRRTRCAATSRPRPRPTGSWRGARACGRSTPPPGTCSGRRGRPRVTRQFQVTRDPAVVAAQVPTMQA